MIALLIDADNLSSSSWLEEGIQALEREYGAASIRRAYGSSENIKGLSEVLRRHAIRPFINLSLGKNTTDVALAVDAMELACSAPHPKLVAIGSGDLDFLPLVVRLRERGIKVVCVSIRNKLAPDALPAYDQVIYVGDELPNQVVEEQDFGSKVANRGQEAKQKVNQIPCSSEKPKPSVPKKAAEPKKNVKAKAAGTKSDVSLKEIIAAIPDLKKGDWLSLSQVAKVLHDKKLLAKNAASPKLFRRFPDQFELSPAQKPNEVRFIKT
ncbi:MAG: hypothetical protein H6R14_448 [Proteobacteria bacterium]|nr:hypothetical protein [Pseudomonadota bacterium]